MALLLLFSALFSAHNTVGGVQSGLKEPRVCVLQCSETSVVTRRSTSAVMDPRVQSRPWGWKVPAVDTGDAREGVNFKPSRRLGRWRCLEWNAFWG